MRFHWQNLNEKRGGRNGSGVRHGRAWLTVFAPREPQTLAEEQAQRGKPRRTGVTLAWEWVLGRFSCSWSFGFCKSEDRGVKFSFAIPFILTLYVNLSGGPFAWLAGKVLTAPYDFMAGEDRELSIRFFDWSIWWSVWRDPMAGWSRKVPKWREGCWHPLDTFLGQQEYSSRPYHTGEIVVPMPERSYRGTLWLSEDSWKRPRWPFAKRLLRAKVDMLPDEQIPTPGKGENSYDCGEDALHGWSGPCESASDAVGQIVASVTRTRTKRGGSNWQPEAVRKAARG